MIKLIGVLVLLKKTTYQLFTTGIQTIFKFS